jgi:hypothetical protein
MTAAVVFAIIGGVALLALGLRGMYVKGSAAADAAIAEIKSEADADADAYLMRQDAMIH